MEDYTFETTDRSMYDTTLDVQELTFSGDENEGE